MITHLVDRPLDPDLENGIWIEEDAYRHLIKARRLPLHSRVRLVDGRGRARWATLERLEKRRAHLMLGDAAPFFEPAHDLDLLTASLRRERASWLVEKATEIGVASIRFLRAERAPRSFGDSQLERFRRVAKAALEQSHGARLPQLSGVHPWADLPALLADREYRFSLRPGAEQSLTGGDLSAPSEKSEPQQPTAKKRVALLIGPEGGWTDLEQQQLDALGCQPRHIGARILRIETAAIVGAALLLVGDS